MIEKIPGTNNGYRIQEDTTPKEWEDLTHQIKPRVMICNYETSLNFRTPFWSRRCVTINNKLENNVIYFNTIR